MRSDRDEIKQALKDRINDLCCELLRDGERKGRFWVSFNPVLGDGKPQTPEFKVALDRDVGAWIDWRSGDKGDVIRLVEYVLQTDFRGAMEWSRNWLGMGRMTSRERADFSAKNAERREEISRTAEQRAAERHAAVVRLWDSCSSIHLDSVGANVARRYLGEGRGCPVEKVVNLDPATFRVHSALEWWRGRQGSTPGPKFPALVSAMRDRTGELRAVHCTFLHPDKPTKAPVALPKLMFGEAKGCVIRVSHGPENRPPETAREAHPLIQCEGVEDGFTLAIGVPEARVWSGGSLFGMGAAPVDLPCISTVFVAADNDWSSKTAMRQFDQVLDQLIAQGKPVEVMRSAIGKDFNDGMTE